jgi:hypothetical protein
MQRTPLGPLTHDHAGWRGSLTWQGRTLSLRLRPPSSCSLDDLVRLVSHALSELDVSADRARRYAFAGEPKVPPSSLVLERVEASIPDRNVLESFGARSP